MKIIYKIGIYGFIIPVVLTLIFPALLPVYLVIIFIVLVVKILSKPYNYFIKEPRELAGQLGSQLEGFEKEIKRQEELKDKINGKLEEMLKGGKIDKSELKPLVAQLFQNRSEEVNLDTELDNCIKRYFGTLAEKERVLRKSEDNQHLARSYLQRPSDISYMKRLSIIDDLFNLTPVEFEKWAKTHIFEKEGWQVSETRRTGDGGVDLVLWNNNEKSIAQCKRFKKTVGEPFLRDFYGTMTNEGVSRGYFVTTGLFSLSAMKFAEDKPIVLVDRQVLARKYLT